MHIINAGPQPEKKKQKKRNIVPTPYHFLNGYSFNSRVLSFYFIIVKIAFILPILMALSSIWHAQLYIAGTFLLISIVVL